MSKQVLERLKARFGDRVEIVERNPRRAYVTVANEDWIPVTRYMYEEEKGRLATASGSDRSTGVELLYHFAIAVLPSGRLHRAGDLRLPRRRVRRASGPQEDPLLARPPRGLPPDEEG
jgi:hypothetical protein